MDARLVDSEARLIPVREVLDSLLADCRPHAHALGCARGLDAVPRRAAANGAAYQRKFVAVTPRLDELVASPADRFLGPDWRAKGAREDPDAHQYRQKGAAYVPLARILSLPHPPERRPLRRDELVGRLMTAAVRIDDWQIHDLKDGCDGPGWYTYVLGRLTLKIDNLPIANSWLPMLEAARLGSERKGEAAPAGGNHRSTYAAASASGSMPSAATSSRRPARYSTSRGRTRTPHSELHAPWPARWPRR
jgi:hypothetical protein